MSYGPVRPDLLTAGLIGYWQLNEAGGLTAVDSSGFGHVGTLINSPPWVAGIYGTALNFTQASSQRVSIANAPVIGNISAYTMAAWVKTPVNDTTANNCVYFEGNTGSATQFLYLKINENVTGDVEFGYKDDSAVSGTLATVGSVSINDGNWHFIVGVQRAKNDRELYVDGVSKNTNAVSVGACTFNSSNIGAGERTTITGYAQSTIDQVRLYNRALTVAEISALNGAQR